jgi:hypothetical protein
MRVWYEQKLFQEHRLKNIFLLSINSDIYNKKFYSECIEMGAIFHRKYDKIMTVLFSERRATGKNKNETNLWLHNNATGFKGGGESGRPEESHLQSPSEPYVNLSIHTAPASHSLETSRSHADAERNPVPPSCLVDHRLPRAGSSPSLQSHYRTFITNTGWSVPFMCIDTFPLRGSHL